MAKVLSVDELACTYSALILADDDIPITAEKITTLLKAANVDVENIWPALFARALQGQDVKQMLSKIGSGVAAPAAGAAAAAGGAAAGEASEAKKEEAKKEESEESEDDDMGFGLFD